MPKCDYCGIRDDACVEDADGTFCIYCRTLALEMRGYNVPMPDVEAMHQDYYFSWDDFENAHVEEDFYDALQHPSPDLTVRDARIMSAYLARIGTEEYR